VGQEPDPLAGTDPLTARARLFEPRYRTSTLGVVLLASLVAFEGMAISTAMPVAARALGGVREYGLAFSLFLTTSILGIVVAGGWVDRRGVRAPILVSLLSFAAGLVVCGAATTFPMLLLGRAVSGFGGGLQVVCVFVAVGLIFPSDLQPRVFGAISAAWVLPSVLGPPLAGFLTTAISWRAVFLVVPPLMVLPIPALWPRLRGVAGPADGGPGAAEAGPGASWFQGRPGLKVDRVRLLATGCLVMALSVLALAVTPLPAVPPWVVAPIWLVGGFGMGLAMASTSVLTLRLTRPGEEGHNSAGLQLGDNLGVVLGIGLGGAVFAAGHNPAGDDTAVYSAIWLVLGTAGLLAAAVALRVGGEPRSGLITSPAATAVTVPGESDPRSG